MDQATSFLTGLPTKHTGATGKEKQILDSAGISNTSSVAARFSSNLPSASAYSGPTFHSTFLSGVASSSFKCQLLSDNVVEGGRVVLAEGNASSTIPQADVLRDPPSGSVLSGNMSVKARSSGSEEGVHGGALVVALSETAQTTGAIGKRCGEQQTWQINATKPQGYIRRKYDSKCPLKYSLEHSSKEERLQPVQVQAINCELLLQDTADSARSTVEKRKIMCCDAEETLISASDSHTSTSTQRSSCSTTPIEQTWSQVAKRGQKKKICLHPLKTSTRLSNCQQKLGEAAPLCIAGAKFGAIYKGKPDIVCSNSSFEASALLDCQRLHKFPLFKLDSSCCSPSSNFEKLALEAGTVHLCPRLRPLTMAQQRSAIQLQGYSEPGPPHEFPLFGPHCSATRSNSTCFNANEVHYQSGIGEVVAAERAGKLPQKPQKSHSLCPTELGLGLTLAQNNHRTLELCNRRKLSRICKAFQARLRMRICFGSWLSFCRKSKELRLQQELQHLRSLKSTAMNCLLQWASLFVAVGARRFFLSLRGFRAFFALASERHQNLHAGR